MPTWAGGLFLAGSDATIDGNVVLSNTTGINGAGHYLYDCQGIGLTGNDVRGNWAPSAICGGGLYVERSNAALFQNTISQNTAVAGGGLYAVNSQ